MTSYGSWLGSRIDPPVGIDIRVESQRLLLADADSIEATLKPSAARLEQRKGEDGIGDEQEALVQERKKVVTLQGGGRAT